MSDEASGLFTRLAPVLNVRDLPAERAFYERLGLPVIYEGPEYPDFIGFGTETVHFGIQKATADNDPPGVLTWQIGVTDIDTAIRRCRSAGISFDLEDNNLAPGWTYRRRRPGQHRGVDLVAVMQPGSATSPLPGRSALAMLVSELLTVPVPGTSRCAGTSAPSADIGITENEASLRRRYGCALGDVARIKRS